MKEKQGGFWHNFVTEEKEWREMPDTDDEATQFFPQSAAALNLYWLHRQMGKTVKETLFEVLGAHCKTK